MEAVLCLKNISSNEDNSTKIGKLRGLELLLHTINTTKSENLKKVCALTIQALAKNRKYLILDLLALTHLSANNMKIIESIKKRSVPISKNE